MSPIARAIASLYPTLNFADVDGTLAGVRYDAPLPQGFTPPTQAEVDAEIARLSVPKIVVSRLRLKLQLITIGKLSDVEAAVTQAGATAQLYWAEAGEFESDHPLVAQIGAAIGLNKAAIQKLFEDARDMQA